MLRERLAASPSGDADPDELVFTTPTGCPVRQGLYYRREFKPAVAKALPHKAKVPFHDLRHTCVALLVEQGAHPKLIQTRLGHSSITITLNRYGHVFPSMDAQLADALEVAYQSSNGNVTPLRRPESLEFASGGGMRAARGTNSGETRAWGSRRTTRWGSYEPPEKRIGS